MLFGDPETPLQVGQIGQIQGTVTDDASRSGVYQPGDPGVAGDTVFVDVDKDGTLDSKTVSQAAVSPQVPLCYTRLWEYVQVDPHDQQPAGVDHQRQSHPEHHLPV